MEQEHEQPVEPLRIVLSAGGTGGHIFPALAVLERLQQLTSGSLDARFLGSDDRMESTMLPQLGYKFTSMPIRGFRGINSISTLSLPLRIIKSVRIARRVVQGHNASVVLTTGAYISYPAGIAAIKEHVPLVIMESNVNPGKTNLRLSKKASAILLAFEEGRDYFPKDIQSRIHVIGNPVRRQIAQVGSVEDARKSFGLDPHRTTVLVFGGSLGARAINNAVEDIIRRWERTNRTPDYQIIWQTGRNYTAEIPEAHRGFVVTRSFLDDMGLAYSASDIVVSRSGATTIAELAMLAKPAILVPLPSASTNEQRINADVAAKRGGAIVVDNADVGRILGDTLEAVLIDPRRREKMAQKMSTLATPRAADDAAQIVLDIAK